MKSDCQFSSEAASTVVNLHDLLEGNVCLKKTFLVRVDLNGHLSFI